MTLPGTSNYNMSLNGQSKSERKKEPHNFINSFVKLAANDLVAHKFYGTIATTSMTQTTGWSTYYPSQRTSVRSVVAATTQTTRSWSTSQGAKFNIPEEQTCSWRKTKLSWTRRNNKSEKAADWSLVWVGRSQREAEGKQRVKTVQVVVWQVAKTEDNFWQKFELISYGTNQELVWAKTIITESSDWPFL